MNGAWRVAAQGREGLAARRRRAKFGTTTREGVAREREERAAAEAAERRAHEERHAELRRQAEAAEEEAARRVPDEEVEAASLLRTAANPWRARRAAGAAGAAGARVEELALSLLNRLSAETFKHLSERFLRDVGAALGAASSADAARASGPEEDADNVGGAVDAGELAAATRLAQLRAVAQLLVTKACRDRSYAVLYARLAFLIVRDGTGVWAGLPSGDARTAQHSPAPSSTHFRAVLVDECQARLAADHAALRAQLEPLRGDGGGGARASQQLEWEDANNRRRDARVTLGRFVGELFRQGVIPEALAHRAILALLHGWNSWGTGQSPEAAALAARDALLASAVADADAVSDAAVAAPTATAPATTSATTIAMATAVATAPSASADWAEEVDEGGVHEDASAAGAGGAGARRVRTAAEEAADEAAKQARARAEEASWDATERLLALEQLLVAAGAKLEVTALGRARAAFDAYFLALAVLERRVGLPKRVHFLLQRLQVLRASNWQSRRDLDQSASKTRLQVKEEALLAELDLVDPSAAAALRAEIAENALAAAVAAKLHDEETPADDGGGWETVAPAASGASGGAASLSSSSAAAGGGASASARARGAATRRWGGLRQHDGPAGAAGAAGAAAGAPMDATRFVGLCQRLTEEYGNPKPGVDRDAQAASFVRAHVLAGVDEAEERSRSPRMLLLVERTLELALRSADAAKAVLHLVQLWHALALVSVGPSDEAPAAAAAAASAADAASPALAYANEYALLQPRQIVDGLVLALEQLRADAPLVQALAGDAVALCIARRIFRFRDLQRAVGSEGSSLSAARSSGALAGLVRHVVQRLRKDAPALAAELVADLRAELWAKHGQVDALRRAL